MVNNVQNIWEDNLQAFAEIRVGKAGKNGKRCCVLDEETPCYNNINSFQIN